MSEIARIVTLWENCISTGSGAVLATVVHVTGSHYRRPGAKMLIGESGISAGSISGGCLEADLRIHAAEVLQTNEPKLVRYETNLEGDLLVGTQTGCGGTVDILIEPTGTAAGKALLGLLRHSLSSRENAVAATVYRTGGIVTAKQCDRFVVYSDGEIDAGLCDPALISAVEGKIKAIFAARKSANCSYITPEGQADLLLEFVGPPVSLVLFGAGDDSIPIYKFSAELGWQVAVVDNRNEYLTPARFGGAILHAVHPQAIADLVPLDTFDAAVIMTHNYERDLVILRQVLPSNVKYAGLLGSRKRAQRLMHALAESGLKLTPEQLARFYAPVGLDIGAEGPHEIAVSVIGEINAVLTGTSGRPLRDVRSLVGDPERTLSFDLDDWK